jgi:hypothetical protein
MPRPTSRQARAAGSALMVLPSAPGSAGAEVIATRAASLALADVDARQLGRHTVGAQPVLRTATVTVEVNVAVAAEPCEGSSSQSAAAVGSPPPGRHWQAGPSQAQGWPPWFLTAPRPGGVQPCGLGQSNYWWVCAPIGVWLAIVLAPCSGPVLAARMVLASVGGHGPQPEVGELIDDLQLQGRRAASAWPGLGLRSGE